MPPEAKVSGGRATARPVGVERARPDAAPGKARPDAAPGKARPDAAPGKARPDATRRTARPLLDPHGIYGTRTASRLRAAQRRRTAQTLLLFVALIGLGFSLATWARARRVLRVSDRWTRALMAVPCAPPALMVPGAKPHSTRTATLLAPTEEGLLLAVDAASGTLHSAFTTAFPLRAQPLAVGDTVFLGGSDGVFSAVAWSAKRTIWARRTSAGFSSRPAFARLLLPARASETTLQPVAAHPSVVRLTVSNRLISAVSDASAGPSPGPGAATGARMRRGVVFAGHDAGEIIAMEATGGDVLWRFNAKAPVGAGLTATSDGASTTIQGESAKNSPAMSTHGARLLVPLLGGLGSSGGVLCLDAHTGRVLWRKDLGAACLPAPVAEEGTTETASRSKSGSRSEAAGVSRSVAAAGEQGRVYCCTDSGAVLCLDLQTGRKIWKIFVTPLAAASRQNSMRESQATPSGGAAANSEAANSDSTYAPGDDSQGDGAQIDSAQGSALPGSGAVSGDNAATSAISLRGEPLLHAYAWGRCLVLGGNDGGVRCFNARDGALMWSFDARFAVRCRPAALLLDANGQAQGDDDASSNNPRGTGATRDLILIGSDGPVVYALEARDGALAWQFATRGPALYTPFLFDQQLVAVTGAGYAQSFALPR